MLDTIPPTIMHYPLRQLLTETSHRQLVAIARALALPGNSRSPKSELVATLEEHLGSALSWRRCFWDLEDVDRAGLVTLAQHGGSISLPAFEGIYGPLRPWRPWKDGVAAFRPWRNPESTTERLVYRGMAFVPRYQGSMAPDEIHVAREYLEWIPVPAPARDQRVSPGEIDPLHDLVSLLMIIANQDLALRGDGQPTTAALEALRERLKPQELTRGRQGHDRCRLVIGLAGSLGLVHDDRGFLRTTPDAVAWFDRGAARCWLELWKLRGDLSDIAESSGIRKPRRLADSGELRSITLGILERLRLWPDDQPVVASRLDGDAIPARLGEWVLTTLLRPMGMVAPTLGPGGLKVDQQAWQITLAGAWLLGRSEGVVPSRFGSLTVDSEMHIQAEDSSAPVNLLHLRPWIEWDGRANQYRFSRRSIARGRARHGVVEAISRRSGRPLGTILDGWQSRIEARLAQPLPKPARFRLNRWLREARIARITQQRVIEADDALLEELRGSPHIRALVSSDPGMNGLLVQPEERASLYDLLTRMRIETSDETAVPGRRTSTEYDRYLVGGLLLLAHFSEHLDTPASAILPALADCDSDLRAAGEQLAARVIAGLHASTAPGAITALDPKRQAIDEAVREASPLRMGYWSRREGRLIERVVEPLDRYTTADREYVTAHCRLRGAERTFRLDRIVWLKRCGSSEPS